MSTEKKATRHHGREGGEIDPEVGKQRYRRFACKLITLGGETGDPEQKTKNQNHKEKKERGAQGKREWGEPTKWPVKGGKKSLKLTQDWLSEKIKNLRRILGAPARKGKERCSKSQGRERGFGKKKAKT